MEPENFLRIIFRQSFRFQICEFQDVILGCWIFTQNPLRHYFGGGVGFTWGGPISGLWSWIPILRSWLWSWLWRFSGRPALSSKHHGWLSGCSTAVGPATTRQGRLPFKNAKILRLKSEGTVGLRKYNLKQNFKVSTTYPIRLKKNQGRNSCNIM